jgi:hypothetical protein
MRMRTVTSRTDDRVLPVTWVVAAMIVPFLVVVFAILYLLPHATDRLFAWTILPQMSALLMGAGYASGVYFFICVVRAAGAVPFDQGGQDGAGRAEAAGTSGPSSIPIYTVGDSAL